MTDKLAEAINNLATTIKWTKWAELQQRHSGQSTHNTLTTAEILRIFKEKVGIDDGTVQ